MTDHNTCTVKSILESFFDRVGIANKERFENAPEEYHPGNILDNFQTVIVYAQGNENSCNNAMGSFGDIWGSIAAQSEVIRFLASIGYKSSIIQGDSRRVSLVHMGIEAGLGEMSPVNSLVIKGLGLTGSLAAIITDAPLIPDEKVKGICSQCFLCMKVCPAAEVAYQRDPQKCGCGKCRYVCPA